MRERTALEIAGALEVELERLTSCLFAMQNGAKTLAAERDAAIADAVAAEREAIEDRVRALPNPHDGLTLGSVIRAIRARGKS